MTCCQISRACKSLRLQAMLHEFKLDYNQKHFVRNETFKKAADSIQVRTNHPGINAAVAPPITS